jgi:hypothetical protein
MGLIKKIFGGSDSKPGGPPSIPIAENPDDSAEEAMSRNAQRGDLVRTTLRETMRQHGIPSDWIDFRSLSAPGPQQQPGMHVQLLVRKADQQLLGYVHAFQEAFWQQILRVDGRARDWLFSLGWEFYGQSAPAPMPGRASWQDTGGDTQPPDQSAQELATDLEALQALMKKPAEASDLAQAASAARGTGP